MTVGELAPPVIFLTIGIGLYVTARIGRDRAVAKRDAWRARQRAEQTPAE